MAISSSSSMGLVTLFTIISLSLMLMTVQGQENGTANCIPFYEKCSWSKDCCSEYCGEYEFSVTIEGKTKIRAESRCLNRCRQRGEKCGVGTYCCPTLKCSLSGECVECQADWHTCGTCCSDRDCVSPAKGSIWNYRDGRVRGRAKNLKYCGVPCKLSTGHCLISSDCCSENCIRPTNAAGLCGPRIKIGI